MSKKLLWILIGAGVLLVAGGWAAAFFMLGGKPAGAAQVETESAPGVLPMETFLVNINDPNTDRYAKLSLSLAIAPADLAEQIHEDALLQARMRDRVLTLLSSKSATDLMSPLGKETFRREVKLQLEPLIQQGELRDVLFSEFVVQ